MSKKNKNSKVVLAVRVKNVFIYTSVCCSAPAKKPPVERSASDRAENKFSECTLGKWHCTKCAKNCKVTRNKAKESTPDGTGTEQKGI